MEQINEPFYQVYLRQEFDRRKQALPGYSLRKFARELQLDATALSRILRGKELLSIRSTRSILANIQIDGGEKEKFIASVLEAQRQRWLN